jgi:hypothetical protein
MEILTDSITFIREQAKEGLREVTREEIVAEALHAILGGSILSSVAALLHWLGWAGFHFGGLAVQAASRLLK